MDKQVLNQLTYGLFVLTTKHNGCIINTAFQVTHEPERLCVVVNKSNYTHDLLKKENRFNISILNEEVSFDLISHFGFQKGRETDKFQMFNACELAPNGIYYITKGTNAYISCKVVQTVDLGTHTMFIGDIEDMCILNHVPSATYQYYHTCIKLKATVSKENKTIYRCTVCGYEYVGGELPDDFICPWCYQPADVFEKVDKK